MQQRIQTFHGCVHDLFNEFISVESNEKLHEGYWQRIDIWCTSEGPLWTYYPTVLSGKLMKTTNCQDSLYPGRDDNLLTVEQEGL
jgi:hypothetical protein